MPRRAARAAASAAEISWRALRLRGAPPIDRAAVATIGQEVTVSDAKARRELGYRSAVSRDAGLAALGAAPPAGALASPDTAFRD